MLDTHKELIKALERNMVEMGSLVCLGCGHEHNCSTRGCAILKDAATAIQALTEQVARLTAERDAATKCINGIETYTMLGSARYVWKTIQRWRCQKEGNHEVD